MKKILSVFLFTILAVSVTHAEGLVYTSGTGGPYKPTFTFSNTLRFNAKNNDVVELQKTLISKGYLKSEATGYFGKLTFAAVKAFQKDNKLKDDGIVGKVTKNLLIQEINAPISNGTPQIDVSDAINPQTNAVPCTASTPASIKVLSPNGGETYQAGQQVTVKWKTCNVSSNSQVLVALHQDGIWQNVVYLSNSTINDGSEIFTIPSSIALGNYKVRVGSSAANIQQDFSDNLFTITASQQSTTTACASTTAPWIKVLSPNGGESYINTQAVTVKWTSCNIPANTQLIVELMSNNDGIMNVFVQNTGTYTFQLSANALMNPPVTPAQPVVYGQYFKVHVGTPPTIFPSYHDWSDGLFTITSPVSLTN